VENGFATVNDQRMTGVIASLKAYHDICIFGEEVDDLALAFVPPLSSDDCDVGHLFISDLRFPILD
jgi:hypothetical protein